MLESFASHLKEVSAGALMLLSSTAPIFALGCLVSYIYQTVKLRRGFSLKGMFFHSFPPKEWGSKSTQMDILVYIFYKLRDKFLALNLVIISVLAAAAIGAVLRTTFPSFHALRPGVMVMMGVSLALFMASDFASFFTHWMHHKVPFLWELHKVHHSATFLSPLTALRMHPIATIIDGAGAMLAIGPVLGVAQFVYGLSLPEMGVLEAYAAMIGQTVGLSGLKHSHIAVSFGPFDRILVSPHMHQLHHSAKYEHWDKNMGNVFSIWDRMFGTQFVPAKNEKIVYGIGRGPEADKAFETPYGIYIQPVIDMGLVLIGRKRIERRPPLGATEVNEAAGPNSAAVDPGITNPNAASQIQASPIAQRNTGKDAPRLRTAGRTGL